MNFARVNKDVEPKKFALASAKAEFAVWYFLLTVLMVENSPVSFQQVEAGLKLKQSKLKEVEDRVTELGRQLKDAEQRKEDLTNQVTLIRAEFLLL